MTNNSFLGTPYVLPLSSVCTRRSSSRTARVHFSENPHSLIRVTAPSSMFPFSQTNAVLLSRRAMMRNNHSQKKTMSMLTTMTTVLHVYF